jgi:hypothetical protein
MLPWHRALPLSLLSSFVFAACQSPEHHAAAEPKVERAQVPPLAADHGATAIPPASKPTPTTIHFGDSWMQRDLPPFFAGTTYDAAIPNPDTLLRQPVGTFTAHHAEIMAAMRAMAAKSNRMRVVPFGVTHEGRELVSVVIASPENLQRIDAIRADIAKLADPRGVDAAEIERIVKSAPAIAWLGYSIHGDEMSGSDASVAVAYHYAAGTSADVLDTLKNVVIVIDPMLNPDGRERVLSQIEQSAGYVANLDYTSMHRGRWPYGRENHYLFDMNRDWLWGTQPETRARWAAIGSWHPQLLVDAHEMGPTDSFLFYPATDPFTPSFPEFTKKWWQIYAGDEAAAFDKHGWSYYTREWADSWYPGYTDSWASFIGACGILYEQAHFRGQALRRPSGEVVTYRDAVEHQAVGSVSNVTTLSKNRETVLRDYVAAKQKNCAADTAGNERTFVLALGRNPDRERQFVANLTEQGIEVWRADEDFTAKNVLTVMSGKKDSLDLKAGVLVVPARQPLSPLVKAMLEFDPRYDKGSLERERKELERKQRSKAYDVTGWSPTHAFDLDGYWCDSVTAKMSRVTGLPPANGGVVALANAGEPVYAWVVDGTDDTSVVFAGLAMELGLHVNLADEPFTTTGRKFARGSLLVRRHENGDDVAAKVAEAAKASGAVVYATGTARSRDDGPDLGGQHFDLLARPRIAVLSNSPVDTSAFGHVWHLLDTKLHLPCSHLDAQNLGGYDLRRYNVIVAPDGSGSVLNENAETLRTWIRSGGTLIAIGGAASSIAGKDSKLSQVRARGEVLDDLDKYALSVKRERAAGKTPIDESALYDEPKLAAAEKADGAKKDEAKSDASKKDDTKADDSKKDDSKKDDAKKGDDKSKSADDKEDKKRHDRYLATFSPQGVILRGEVNPDAWITVGCRDELPCFFEGDDVLMSELPVRTAVRLAAPDRLRLSGLLWPEAKERIADSAYCTVERSGAGQVILFASTPIFRAWYPGSGRLLSNALVYGPGAGANQPGAW